MVNEEGLSGVRGARERLEYYSSTKEAFMAAVEAAEQSTPARTPAAEKKDDQMMSLLNMQSPSLRQNDFRTQNSLPGQE